MQMTLDPNDVINALNARLATEAQRNIMLEAALAKMQRDLAEARQQIDAGPTEPAE